MAKQKEWKERPVTKGYPSDISDEEWALVAPYLILMDEEAPQREYALRDVFNGLRWIARAGAPWRMMPLDLPPGILSTNRRNDGCVRVSSSKSCMICACF